MSPDACIKHCLFLDFGCFDCSWSRAFSRRLLSRAPRIFDRIGHRGAPDSGKGRERMNLSASRTHDVLGANTSNQQIIGDKRTMTAPRYGFSAHQNDAVLLCTANQFFQALPEFRRLHVIGIPSKGGISPTHVGRIAPRVAQATESRQVNVVQAGFLQ